MADTFNNPYTMDSPIGAALKNLSTVITKAPSEAQQILLAEKALELRRTNENTVGLGNVFQQYGTPGFDRNTGMNMAIRAGVDPSKLAGFERYGAANTFGATDPRTTNASVGAGGSYSGTAHGFREDQANTNQRAANTLAETVRQFDQKPMTVGSDTGPVIVPQAQAYGRPAVEDLGKVKGDMARRALNTPGGIAGMNPVEQQFIGAESKATPTPRNYVAGGQSFITYDGVSDARTSQPLPAGGYMANAEGPAEAVGLRPNVQGDLQKQDIANQRFKGLLGFTRNLAQKDANNFGVAGMVKGGFQDAAAVAGNISQGLGYNGVQDAVKGVRERAMAGGVDPGLLSGVFDPNLPALHTSADLLVFSAAEALAGQSGRAVSNKDVALFKQIIGDPREWTGNQEKYLAKLDTIEQILGLNQGVVDQRLRGASPGPAQAAPGATPTPGAPGAPPIQPAAPQGQLPVVNSPADAARLPSGTRFRTPDGREKVVP